MRNTATCMQKERKRKGSLTTGRGERAPPLLHHGTPPHHATSPHISRDTPARTTSDASRRRRRRRWWWRRRKTLSSSRTNGWSTPWARSWTSRTPAPGSSCPPGTRALPGGRRVSHVMSRARHDTCTAHFDKVRMVIIEAHYALLSRAPENPRPHVVGVSCGGGSGQGEWWREEQKMMKIRLTILIHMLADPLSRSVLLNSWFQFVSCMAM